MDTLIPVTGDVLKERRSRPSDEGMKLGFQNMQEAFLEKQDKSKRQGSLMRAAIFCGRRLGVVPATGYVGNMSIEGGKVAFAESVQGVGETETVILSPYSDNSVAMDVNTVITNEMALIDIALIKNDPAGMLGVREVMSEVSVSVNGEMKIRGRHLEIYEKGRKTGLVQLDDSGVVLAAFTKSREAEGEYVSGASNIPEDVRLGALENKSGQVLSDPWITKAEKVEDLVGKHMDLARLDRMMATVDGEGALISSDLKSELSNLLKETAGVVEVSSV